MLALNGADQLNGPRQWGSLLFCLVIVLSLQRAEGSTEETGSSYTKIRILPQSGEYLRQYVATTPQRIADCWRNRVHARLSDPPPVITEVSVFDRSQHVAGLIIP